MKTREPVIAGNKVLGPGSYVWKLLDSSSDRHIVQITDEKTGKVQTTILAIPTFRQVPAPENTIQFWETPKGLPRAVRSWFYPGDNYGQGFVYPRRLLATMHPKKLLRPHRGTKLLAAAANSAEDSEVAMVHPPALPEKDQPEAQRGGSWAVITGDPGGKNAHPDASTKQRGGLWDTIKKLPLTATLGPLIGLIGIVALVLWLVTYAKRRNGNPALSKL